jgi:catechol 2,3-dioxygenase-like lactoylglutathione lyase family enzyme
MTMSVKTLDHVNIRSALLEETYAFYVNLLGLTLTPFPGRKDTALGAWLCDETRRPVVHVAHVDAAYGDGKEGTPASRGSGAIHHVAFECVDYDTMHRRLVGSGQRLRTNEVPSIGLRQIFAEDPNGITVELNFRDA